MGILHKKAFTLSEVLLALAVIGILAAMTIPSVSDNINRRMMTAKFKNTYLSIQDLAKEKISHADNINSGQLPPATTTLNDSDFASSSSLLNSQNFDVSYNCSSTKKCWGSTYKPVGQNTTLSVTSQTGIKLKNGVAIRYLVETDPSSNPFSDDPKNTEFYYGTFYVDVNGEDRPNILGRDLFIFKITDKGRLGDNLANKDGTKDKSQLLAACKDGSKLTACATYLELNNWNMDY